ncbi:MAG: RND family transporter [Candidatus Binatia bacterium]
MYGRFVTTVIKHPARFLLLVGAITVGFATQLPKLRVSTDYRQFLPVEDEARYNLDFTEGIFGEVNLTMIVVLREDHPDGIYNPDTLAVIARISDWLTLQPEFETSVNSDLRSLSTVNNVLGDEAGLVVNPFMEQVPSTREAALAIRDAVEENDMFNGTLTSRDGKGALILVRESDLGNRDQQATYLKVKAFLDGLRRAGHPEEFYLAGRPITQGLFGIYIPAEGRRLLPFVLSAIALFLALSFRSVRAILICFSVIAGSEIWMLGFLALWGHPFYTITSILPVLIVPIAVADSIHLLAKYYDLQFEHPDAEREFVVQQTMHEMGPPVFMTSLTTAIGFLSMTASPLVPVRDFGLLTAWGVLSAFALTLVLIPSLLALLPLHRPKSDRRVDHLDTRSPLGRSLGASSELGNEHPYAVLAALIGVFVVCAAGMTLIRVDSSQITQFPPHHHLRKADAAVNGHFAGSTLLDIVVDGGKPDAIKDPDLLNRIVRLQSGLEQNEFVGNTFSIAELIKRMNFVLHESHPGTERIPKSRESVAQYLLLYSISGDPGDFDDLIDYDYRYARVQIFLNNPGTAAARSVLELAHRLIDNIFPGHDACGAKTVLSGATHVTARMEHHVIQGQIRTLALCFPVLFALGWYMFSHLRVGLLMVCPVALAISVAYGAMGFVGIPADVANVLLGGMTLGIGVDFAIHYLHRYVAYREDGEDHRTACRLTALTTGRALFYNALVLTAGFVVMLSARLYPQIKLGALATATLIVCYVSTLYIFPAALSFIAFDSTGRSERREKEAL